MDFANRDELREYLEEKRRNSIEKDNITEQRNRLDSDKYIDVFCDDLSISEEDFIDIIAYKRISAYSMASGGGNANSENAIRQDYSSNPWKFVEEFLQNADDCNYSDNPSLEIIIDEIGSYVEFVYNETGFTRKDIWSLTAFAQSQKSEGDTLKKNDVYCSTYKNGLNYFERTGRKGIGFKSVFTFRGDKADNVIVSISSNGFSFDLNGQIGSIIPIWNSEFLHDDQKTHVRVYFENPNFDNTTGNQMKYVYDKLKELFCVDCSKEKRLSTLFSSSPILFTRNIKEITVTYLADNNESFSTSLRCERTRYANTIDDDKKKLSCIFYNGKLYEKEIADCTVLISENDKQLQISALRLSVNRCINGIRRIFSVIAPVIKDDSDSVFSEGALFRTFSLSDNTFAIPLAIDAPFELNQKRSGVLYSRSEYNTLVSDTLFLGEECVVKQFFMLLRGIEGVRIEFYLRSEKAEIFRNDDNKDLMEIVKIGKQLRALPLFRIKSDNVGYVSYSEAKIFEKEIYNWPQFDYLATMLLGTKNVNRVIMPIYNIKPNVTIVTGNVVSTLNKYLDIVEKEYGVDSDNMFNFVNSYLYPFIQKNREFIGEERLKSIRFLFSRVYTSSGIIVKRESYADIGAENWFHSKDTTPSINKFRIWESSPVDTSIINDVINSFRSQDISLLGKKFGNNAAWQDIKDYIEAIGFYRLTIKYMSVGLFSCVLSEKYSPKDNLFRKYNILETIPDSDIEYLAQSFNNDSSAVVELLRKLGIEKSSEFFRATNKRLSLSETAKKLFRIIDTSDVPFAFNKMLDAVKGQKHAVDIRYEEVKSINKELLIYILRDTRIFNTDNLIAIADRIVNEVDLENVIDTVLMIEALNKARNKKLNRNVNIGIETVLNYRLTDIIHSLTKTNRNITIINDGYFHEIPELEIAPLINTFDSKIDIKEKHFYAGEINKPGKAFCLADMSGNDVFLNVDENGDYTRSLIEGYLNSKADRDKIQALQDMKAKFEKVYEEKIKNELDAQEGDINDAFERLKENFSQYSKSEIIAIISWFRYAGSSKAAGNSMAAISNNIKQEYENEPWRFVYEFIQNVDDCTFDNSERNKLDISISDNGIVFEYNEVGFSIDDILSLTSFDDSTKKGFVEDLPHDGVNINTKTGRKGRGFKSVFALPADNLIVKIWSNGFSFMFYKCLGIIIPIWNDETCDVTGTRISIEGLDSDTCKKIASKLDSFLGIKEKERLFSSCPVLFLRNINRISFENFGRISAIEIISNRSENQYYEMIEVPANCRINGCIKSNGALYKSAYESYTINVQHESTKVSTINAGKYSKAFVYKLENREEMYVVSIFHPIIRLEDEMCYNMGALYHTLPMSNEVFELPLAINAEFETNNDRSDLKSDDSVINHFLADSLCMVIEGAYERIRCIENIDICKYYRKGITVFNKVRNFESFSISDVISSIPIYRNESGDMSVSPSNAITMPKDMIDWPKYAYLSVCFGVDNAYLINREYLRQGNTFDSITDSGKTIRVIDCCFVEHINDYINYLRSSSYDAFKFCKESLFNYMKKHYYKICDEYKREDKKVELGNLCIFPFDISDESIMIESIGNDGTIWFDDKTCCDKLSYGVFRNIRTLSENYEEHRLWIKEIADCAGIEIMSSVNEAFGSKALRNAKKDFDWAWIKSVIEASFYYRISTKYMKYIPGLESCVLDDDLSGEQNIFCIAAKVVDDNDFVKHIITEDDIVDIICDLDVDSLTIEEITEFIKNLNIIRAYNFFENSNHNYSLNKRTKSLLKQYCTTDEKAMRTSSIISNSYSKITSEDELVICYEDIEYCKPVVLLNILRKKDLLSEHYKKRLAKEYYNHNCNISASVLEKAAIMMCYKSCNGGVTTSATIPLNLSEIINYQLGDLIPKESKGKLSIQINIDIPYEPYEDKHIDEVMNWLSDGESAEIEKKYFIADITDAFEDRKTDHYIIVGNEKVILNRSDEKNALYQYAKSISKGEAGNADIGILLDIAIKKEQLLNWERSGKNRKSFINELSRYRKNNQKMIEVLTSKAFESNTTNTTSKYVEYLFAELLQNINDCQFISEDQKRVLRISFDIENGLMKLQYNEAGFTYHNVYSITGLGQSTKHDKSEGEKGLGFKKVFTVFDKVNILSNEFFFALSKQKNEYTEITWDEQYKDDYEFGKTTMVFHTDKKDDLKKLLELVKKLLNKQYVGLPVSPIFLEHIDQYVLDNPRMEMIREDIVKDYLVYSFPIVSTYDKYLQLDNEDDWEKHRQYYYDELKKRRKYEGLSDTEINNNIDSLTFTLCIPKTKKKEDQFYIFSTLPTEDLSYLGMHINVSLELTTGRDHINQSSEYNKAVLSMIFETRYTNISMLGHVLSEIAEKNNDINIWKCLPTNIENYVETYNLEKSELLDEIGYWRVFHEYKTNRCVCLNDSYSIDEILYKYIHSVEQKEIKNDIVEWLEQNYPVLGEYCLIDIDPKDHSFFNKIIDAINYNEEQYFPISDENDNLPIQYFKDEYSTDEEW